MRIDTNSSAGPKTVILPPCSREGIVDTGSNNPRAWCPSGREEKKKKKKGGRGGGEKKRFYHSVP